MKKKILFQYKIGLIMIVVLSMVSVISMYTYKRFSEIVQNVSEVTRPDLRIVTAKTILTDVTDAENKVKSFSLSKDTVYLDQFYQIAEKVDLKLNELRDQSAEESVDINIDTLDYLIGKKLNILNGLLVLQDEFRMQKALDKVVKKIEKTNSSEKSKNIDLDKRKGFLNILLNKRKEEKVKPEENTDKVIISEVSGGIKSVKKEEESIEKALIATQIALMVEDEIISKKIRTILDDFEKKELLRIKSETTAATTAVEETNFQIAMFCIVIGLLLCFMAFIIINYVRTNNRFRQALKKAKRKAEDLAEAKERFLANMSHEIRTPMNAIHGFTEQMAKGPLDKDQREQMNMVQKSTKHLLYLVNDVLDFTKLQTGKLKLEKIGFKPREVITDIINFTKPMASDKNLLIGSEVLDSIPEVLIGDPHRLRQVLLNLMSNSIKFTEYGSITVKAIPVMLNKESVQLRLEISDTGIGMSSEQLKRVFQEFEQAEVSTTRNYGGSGLGLSITRMLVELHEGNIEIKSEQDVGTTLIIEIPFEIGTECDIVTAAPTLDLSYKLKNLKILIVDDESYNRKLLTIILGKHNAIFTEAENGREAVDEVSRNEYDLILMDARMPILNGIEASLQIRELPGKKSQIPILALSAAVSEEDKKRYENAGMNGFLAKPFSEEEIIIAISKVTSKLSNTPKKVSEIVQGLEMQESTTVELDYSELRKISNQDIKFYTDMLQTFISGTEDGLKKIEENCLTENWDAVAEFAHRISSPCRHLSALKLHTQLKEIENRCRNNQDLISINELVNEMKNESIGAIKAVKKELALHGKIT
ncbi:MAG: signal transduction histidine kinase/DNA-binding response OmpR family regulator [Flavobacteriales bacterium]|jgi:signal transduction histidine kinase/DNA-binding response OmpR family regulator